MENTKGGVGEINRQKDRFDVQHRATSGRGRVHDFSPGMFTAALECIAVCAETVWDGANRLGWNYCSATTIEGWALTGDSSM